MRNHITCATNLKRAGDLKIFGFDENVATFANGGCGYEVGVADDALEGMRSAVDLIEGEFFFHVRNVKKLVVIITVLLYQAMSIGITLQQCR